MVMANTAVDIGVIAEGGGVGLPRALAAQQPALAMACERYRG